MPNQRHYVVLVNENYEVWHLAAKAVLTKLALTARAILIASFTGPAEAEALRSALEQAKEPRGRRVHALTDPAESTKPVVE